MRPFFVFAYLGTLVLLLLSNCLGPATRTGDIAVENIPLKSIAIDSSAANVQLQITAPDFTLNVDDQMMVRLDPTRPDARAVMTGFQSTDYVVIDGEKVEDYPITAIKKSEVQDQRGKGTAWIITGKNEKYGIEKTTTYKFFDNVADFIFTQSQFVNKSEQSHIINSLNTNHITVANGNDTPAYWSFQGSSTSARSDWIRPLDGFYYDENYMGMNNSDYGGGIPVADLWRPDIGIAIGHTELKPKLVSFPTEMKESGADASIRMMEGYEYPTWFDGGSELSSLNGFYTLHQGDYFEGLRNYSELMVDMGIEMVPSEDAAYEPIWCAWGYERNFKKEEIIGTLDKVVELGIKWAVVDDGFQIAEGDWNLHPEKFPEGNAEMKSIVDAIHDKGLKAKIWWTPLAADPGSKVLVDHPKAYAYNDEWAPQFITWWNAYYLSPTNDDVVAHTKETIRLFMDEWGFDGLKMDGQHMNAIGPDYNPDSGAEVATDAVEAIPDFFQMIYDEATAIKPHAVIENCPCGTCMSFFNMASMNQAVSSDPLSSWQVRHKGKTYKALIPQTAYYGDHVELSDNASDFASSMGIGAVLGTKFTYPKDNPDASDSFLLTPKKEKIWKQWFGLYNEHMISKGTYQGGLYDVGYDKPEAHVISKDNDLFYAFYAKKWNGNIDFRGLDSTKSYTIYDYVNDRELGTLAPGETQKSLKFSNYLLVQLIGE